MIGWPDTSPRFPMSTQVVVALVTAGTALAVSVVNYVTKKQSDASLERLKDELAGAREEDKARRDYEYEARKRLYAEFQPLLFQLCELCESAYFRIRDLAERARAGELDSWLRDEPYRLSTLHRLVAPLVIFRLCQRRLTFADLTVEPRIRAQYALAKQLYLSWTGAFALAQAEPSVEYQPYGGAADSEAVSALQHIVIGDLDRLIEAMTVREPDGAVRCISYGEFEDESRKEGSPLLQAVSNVDEVLVDFHPRTRPVLWRVLLTQAHLHKTLVHSLQAGLGGSMDALTPTDALTREERQEFDWRDANSGEDDSKALDEPFAAVRQYLAGRFSGAWGRAAEPAPRAS
jgi:hypothetical protein